jgi:beta-N-acetylhexosaminidase
MTDDISMGALSGPIAERSRAAVAAGCDLVLHCNGDLVEMEEVAGAVSWLAGEARARGETALALRAKQRTDDLDALRAEFTSVLDGADELRRSSL